MTHLFAFFVSSLMSLKESDSVPSLHSYKDEEIDTVLTSYKDQTIAVKLKTGNTYIYQKEDWSKEFGQAKGKVEAAATMLSRTFTKVEVPPSFPGGDEAWGKYIEDICAQNKKLIRKEGPAVVVVQFIVDNEGGKYYIQVISPNSPPGLAALAQKAIEDSPTWQPATQNGHIVISYARQKVAFK